MWSGYFVTLLFSSSLFFFTAHAQAPPPPVAGITLTGCQALSTTDTCVAAGCLWDVYLPVAMNNPQASNLCYSGVASVMFGRTCADWSGLIAPNTAACAYHGCALIGNQCLNVDSGSTTTTDNLVTALIVDAAFVNPHMDANSLDFQFDVLIGFTFNLTYPTWPIVSFGDYQWLSTHPPVMNNGPCNSLGHWNSNGPKSVTYSGSQANIEAYCTNWVNTYHTFNFNNDAEGLACTAMSGGSENLFVGSGGIVNWVGFQQTGLLKASVKYGLTDMVNHCGTDVQQFLSVTPSYSLYTVAPRVTLRDHYGAVGDASDQFFVTFITSGSVTITANSRYRQTVRLEQVKPTYHGCAIGQQRLNTTYLLTYSNIADPTMVTGPRSKADIVFPSTLSCYGEITQSLTRLPFRFDISSWQFVYTTVSACFDIAVDGLAFYSCSRAPDFDTQHWSAVLDQQHTHTIDSWNYPIDNPYAVGPLGLPLTTQVNGNINNDPDYVSSRFVVKVYPNVIENGNVFEQKFRVTGSLLPTPYSLLTEEVIMAYANPSSVVATDTRNLALTYNKTLTWLLHLDTVILNTYDLILKTTPTDMYFVPIDANGHDIVGGRILYWSDLVTLVSHTTKRELMLHPGVNQVTVGACTGHRGCDAIAIPVTRMRTLSNAPGFRTTLSAEVVEPTLTPGVTRRRLLDYVTPVSWVSTPPVATATLTTQFFFVDGDSVSITNETLTFHEVPHPKLDTAEISPDFLGLTAIGIASLATHLIVFTLTWGLVQYCVLNKESKMNLMVDGVVKVIT